MASTGLFVVPNFVVQTAVSTAGAADTTTPVSNAGLIALLPLVGAVVGGIVGAWANSWYRNREARTAREEEREGLLILLSIEVDRNNRLFEGFLKELVPRTDVDFRAKIAENLQSTVWDASKVRLAQLRMPATYLRSAALYYRRMEDLRRLWAVTPTYKAETDIEIVSGIREQGVIVIEATKDYVSDPELVATPIEEDSQASPEVSKEA